MNSLLLYQIAFWVNITAIPIFFVMEIYWFVKQKKRPSDIPVLIFTFLIKNLPFLLLTASMYFQPVPEVLFGVLRLVLLSVCVLINLWLYYNGDMHVSRMGVVFFVVIAAPLMVALEIFIALR